MYKNWKVICGITDPNLRLFVALCNDEVTLAKVAKGFPELFVAEKPEHPGPFPISYLRGIANERLSTGVEIGEVASSMYEIMHRVGLPFFWYGDPSKEVVKIDIPISAEHRTTFEELRSAASKVESFPWGLNKITVNGVEYYTGLWTGDDASDIDVDIYPAALVDEKA